MIHFDFLWALIALPLPLLIYWLPAKKQVQAAPLRMPTIIKGMHTQEFAPEKKKGSLTLFPAFLCHNVTPVTKGKRYVIQELFVGDHFR